MVSSPKKFYLGRPSRTLHSIFHGSLHFIKITVCFPCDTHIVNCTSWDPLYFYGKLVGGKYHCHFMAYPWEAFERKLFRIFGEIEGDSRLDFGMSFCKTFEIDGLFKKKLELFKLSIINCAFYIHAQNTEGRSFYVCLIVTKFWYRLLLTNSRRKNYGDFLITQFMSTCQTCTENMHHKKTEFQLEYKKCIVLVANICWSISFTENFLFLFRNIIWLFEIVIYFPAFLFQIFFCSFLYGNLFVGKLLSEI